MPTAKRLGDVLGSLLRERPFKEHVEAVRVMDAWSDVVGDQIAGMADVQRFRAGKLFVEVNSAPWRHVLHLQREQWRKKLNERLEEEVVEEIVFR